MDCESIYSSEDIHKVRIIERCYLKNKKEIAKINDKMNITYNNVYGIMKRINSNFVQTLINQYEYNAELNKLDSQLQNLKKLPRPFRLRDKLEHSLETIKYIIKNINDNLFEIASKTGTDKIFDAIYLKYAEYSLKEILEETSKSNKNLMYFYNNVFIPVSIHCYELNNVEFSNNSKDTLVVYQNTKKLNRKQYDMNNILICQQQGGCFPMFKKNKSVVEQIQGARLYLKIENQKLRIQDMIVLDGYFLEDPLNISRVGGELEKKNQELVEKIDCLDINKYFKNAFIQQISIRDFVLHNNNTLIEKCSNAYLELQNLKKKTISNLVKEFLLSDFIKQRDILTLFLLMKDDVDTQYLAYLMYDMITNESYLLKPQPLAEQVFNSLHWSVQKLFKVAIKKINKNTNKLLNFNEEEIPYEKRIFLMKTEDYVKSKAMEKYKEYCKSGEGSAKCMQYIDGILKIPFGIYRKEPILSFLDEYRNSLNNFINTYIQDAQKELENNFLNKSVVLNLNLCQEISTNNIIKKTCGNVLGNKDKSLKSQEIEYFINQFNMNMMVDSSKSFEINNVIKYFKKQKKDRLVDFIKLINEDLIKNNINHIIKETQTKNKLLENLSHFLQDYGDLDIIQKYLNFLDIDRKKQLVNPSQDTITNLNNNFFFLNSEWFSYKNNYKKYLKDSNKVLDEAVYHQEEAKTQIKRIIAQWINGEMKGYCFGFEGPPGTGKTSLAKKGISKCLKDKEGNERPFAFIAIGGSSNGATLEGHSYTYVGSTWGRIVDILMETKCMNPIIYIDELDKVSKTEHGKEIIGILTHLTDPSQNDEYSDKYFSGIKLDLSKVLFIFSYNDFSLLDPILADRIHRVKFQKLNKYEKIHIVNHYILPELLETIGFNQGDIIFNKKVLEHIINSYTQEAGVRKLREKIFEILREVNLRYLMDQEDTGITIPLEISLELVEEIFHSKPKFTVKTITPNPRVGLVNGLYATVSGMGGLTIIESFKTPSDSKLNLELTGQQGDVMKESMKVAKTVAWNLIPGEIKKKIYEEMTEKGTFGIHLHCPEGATPKDGPSAGAAITLAIVSLLSEVRVLNTVALTGEIDLNGSVHQIGGLESKIEGGKIAGAQKILYPDSNQKDIDLIREKGNIIDESIEVIPVNNIWQVLDICLEKNDINFQKYTE